MKSLFQNKGNNLLPLFAPIYSGSGQVLLTNHQIKYHMIERDDSESYYYRDGLNPTVNHVEGILKENYQVENARLVQSGMAAINVAIFSALTTGSRLFVSSDTFVDTQLLALEHFSRWGIPTQIFDLTEDGKLPEELILQMNDVVVIESVSNPMCKVADISDILKCVTEKNGILIIDNTIPSSEKFFIPPSQNCIIVESLTKYHLMNTAWAGLVLSTSDFKKQIHEVIKLFGFALNAEAAACLEKSILTLKIRLNIQIQNKDLIQNWLLNMNANKNSNYEIISRNISVEHPFIILKFKNENDALNALSRFTQILPSPSFGGPQTMASIGNFHTTQKTSKLLERRGINGKIIRICCGIESSEILINDLSKVLGI